MSPIRRLFLIMALTAMWSPSFLFIKLAVAEISPITVAMVRVSIAAVILSLILFFRKGRLPTDLTFWIHSAAMAFFASVVPFCLFCYAEQTIESALAAILNGCSPMFTALLAHRFLPSDRLHAQKVVGISLGVVGLLLLFAPNIAGGLNGTLYGMGAAATAAFCYAVSHVYGKKYQVGFAPFVAPTSQLLCSALMLIPLAFIYEDPLSLAMPSVKAIMGVLGLSLFGTILAFIIYYKLLDHCGPTAISMVACFFPVCGMLLGFVFLGESLSWGGLLASFLIFLGLAIVNEVINLKPILAKLSPRKEETVLED